MSNVLIDTNIYSCAMRGEAGAIEIMRSCEDILFSPIVIAELLAGFKGGSREKQNTNQLQSFLAQARVKPLTLGETTAQFFAMIFTDLKSRGNPLPTHDLWIAASAMEHGVPLATQDKHFQKIPGLLLINY